MSSDAQGEALPIALYRISELSYFTENMDDFFREAHAIIGELIYAKNFFIALYDKSHATLSIPYIVDDVTPFNIEEFQNRRCAAVRIGKVRLIDNQPL